MRFSLFLFFCFESNRKGKSMLPTYHVLGGRNALSIRVLLSRAPSIPMVRGRFEQNARGSHCPREVQVTASKVKAETCCPKVREATEEEMECHSHRPSVGPPHSLRHVDRSSFCLHDSALPPAKGLALLRRGSPTLLPWRPPPPLRPCALTAPTTRGALNRPITLHSWEPHPLHPLLPQRCQWPHLRKWQRPLPRPPVCASPSPSSLVLAQGLVSSWRPESRMQPVLPAMGSWPIYSPGQAGAPGQADSRVLCPPRPASPALTTHL